MYVYDATINTLKQLKKYIEFGRWVEIQMNEAEDERYLISLDKAITGLKVVEQCRWERDIATEQLHELGLGLGQKVDGVYLSKEKYEALLEYKYMYENLG